MPELLRQKICLFESFLSSDHQQQLLPYLQSSIDWQQPSLTVFGKTHKIPRQQCWIGDEGLRYEYSGKTFTAEGWSKPMFWLKQKVEQTSGFAFNSCLLNRYRNGDDKMGWHADDEPELGIEPAVAIVSVGSARDIQFRLGKQGKSYSLELPAGSCLLMKPGCQSSIQHQIPARKRLETERVSLTYRYIYPELIKT